MSETTATRGSLIERRDLVSVAALAALFLIATACTFTSLGVVLPRMRESLNLSWSQAGLCFTAMALGCGGTAYAPSWLIARAGLRRTLVAAAAVFALAFGLLGAATGPLMLYMGCALGGLGFSLAAPVAGEYFIARASARPAIPLGAYYATGSLGGVIGPWLPWLCAQILPGQVLPGWRGYWFALAAVVGVIGVLAGLVLREPDARPAAAAADVSPVRALKSWPLYVLWATFLVFLAAESTVNTFGLAHLAAHGIPTAGGAVFLSVSALATVAGRGLGGVLADRFEARGLLIASLASLALGLFGLTLPQAGAIALGCAALIGFGFGASLVASTVLLLRYYGVGPNLSLFGMLNTAGAVAAFAPLAAGKIKDAAGAFDPAFTLLALLSALVLAGALTLPGEPKTRR